MTPPPLPDELRNWPDDPFALLGMDPGGDKKAARRAYAARVRQYKPEDAPEKFQRIREAYESVLQFIAWGLDDARFLVAPSESELTSEPAAPQGETLEILDDEAGEPLSESASAGAAPRRNIDQLLPPEVDDSCRQHWQLAADGEPERAYAGLQECRLREPQRPEIAARLFWLLELFPELDPDRRPIEWLYEGLRSCGPTHPLPELLRRQFARAPIEATRPECWQAIEHCVATPGLLDVCRDRWQALGQLQRFSMIRDDLERLRPLMANSDPQSWSHLLLLALDFLAWSRDREIMQAFPEYVEEAERAEVAGPELHESLARLDLLVEAARGWRELLYAGKVPKRWIQLVPLIWVLPPDRIRPLLIPVLREMAFSPQGALDHFVQMISCSPAAASQLGGAIELFSYDGGETGDTPWYENSVRTIVEEYVQRYGRFGYHIGRKRLLELCLEDCIDPRWFAATLASRGGFMGVDCAGLAHEIEQDAGLRYVYLATRIFLG